MRTDGDVVSDAVEMPAVRRALIPCGGRGTRMRSLTGSAPKEMIPLGGEPLLNHVVRECAASGVTELLVVIAPGKEMIAAEMGRLAGTPGAPASIEIAVQREPRGLADAIRLGRDFAGGAPLAVALPDNLFVGGEPALAQVAETYARTGESVVAIVEIPAAEAARRGATGAYAGRVAGDEFHISRIPDKGAHAGTFDTAGAAAAYTGVGRFVFTPDAFPIMDAVERTLPPGVELDDIPVMQRLLERGRLVGRLIRGRFLDVGLPAGYEEANALLASPGAH